MAVSDPVPAARPDLEQMRRNAELGLANPEDIYLGDPTEDLALLDYARSLEARLAEISEAVERLPDMANHEEWTTFFAAVVAAISPLAAAPGAR